MTSLISLGNNFIWVTSIIAGSLTLLAIYKVLLRRSLSRQKAALLGDWHGYAFFHAKTGDHFYKESITVSRNMLRPWRLNFKAVPSDGSGQTVYRGEIDCAGSYIVSRAHEPVFDDTVFEISRRIMDEEHDGNTIVGLCVGKSYDDHVRVAAAHVWSRQPLGAPPGASRASREIERAKFIEIASAYFEVSRDTFQLKLF